MNSKSILLVFLIIGILAYRSVIARPSDIGDESAGKGTNGDKDKPDEAGQVGEDSADPLRGKA